MDITKPPIEQREPQFDKLNWLNQELIVQGIYLKPKVISKSITANGVYTIECGFPPKIVMASCQDSTECSDGSTDFSFTFSIRKYTDTVFTTSEHSNLVNISSMVANVTKRLTNWFTITVTSFTWSAKNIYFTCYS